MDFEKYHTEARKIAETTGCQLGVRLKLHSYLEARRSKGLYLFVTDWDKVRSAEKELEKVASETKSRLNSDSLLDLF